MLHKIRIWYMYIYIYIVERSSGEYEYMSLSDIVSKEHLNRLSQTDSLMTLYSSGEDEKSVEHTFCDFVQLSSAAGQTTLKFGDLLNIIGFNIR